MLNEKNLTGRAVVLGAGVMGAGIAAMLANFGWTVDLLDRVPDDAGSDPKSRNKLAIEGLDRALKARPLHFTLPENASRIFVGNIEDDLDRLAGADWVVEAVAEEMSAKQHLLAGVAAHVGPQAVISSNTSGLSLAGMSSGCPAEFRSRFLGTHFFNPPRYMKPVELIPTADTDPRIFEGFCRFAERVLGKRVIRAKDTPGFISTRLGIFTLAKTMAMGIERELSVADVDYLTGPLIGRPKSGTYRLADVVGIDIVCRIVDNLRESLPDDAEIQRFEIPPLVRQLVESGRVGAKSGAGFYRKDKSGEIQGLDFKTGEYTTPPHLMIYGRDVEKLPLNERIRAIWDRSPEVDGGFTRDQLRSTLGYMAATTPEVAGRIVEVDDAMISGYGWEAGPFHLLDMLGPIDWPTEPQVLRTRGSGRFYSNESGKHFYFDFHSSKMEPLPRPEGAIVLKDLRKAGKMVLESESASLVDLGDGAACLEWRTKMNSLNPALVEFIDQARERAELDFRALVLGGSGEHFSVGFDLRWFAEKIDSQDWTAIEDGVATLQSVAGRLKRSRIPVVSTAYGYTLGGGCELMLHCAGVQAAFESSIGLPEANVGLIPAGGGTTQRLLRAMESVPSGTILEPADPYPALRPVWDILRLARFSSSADEARLLGYLRDTDGTSRHPDRLLFEAKERALGMNASYRPAEEATIKIMGEGGLARFRWELHLLRRADSISEHDATIAEKMAWIFSGGSLIHPEEVTESYLLCLEREAFLSLCGNPLTLARISHMIDTGKALKN